MKSLSLLVDGILGKEFEWGRHGPDRFYCLGIFLFLVEELHGITIPDPYGDLSPEKLRTFFSRFDEHPKHATLRPLDCLFWRWCDEAHVAVVENDRFAVSIVRGAGVYRMFLWDAQDRAESVFRLKELA